MTFLTALSIVALAVLFYNFSRIRAISAANGVQANLHSRPSYHGLYSFLWVFLVGVTALIIGSILTPHPMVLFGVVAGLSAAVGIWTTRGITAETRARNKAERIVTGILWACAGVAVLTTIGIILSLVFETYNFFESLGWRVDKFLFGTRWSPLSGLQDGVMDPDRVGILPLMVGTLMITAIAMIIAAPIGLLAAIYLSEFASQRVRGWVKPMLEVLAGIPTVVYGFFAAITVAPLLRETGDLFGLKIASESALAAGIVIGIMIIPSISSLADDVINSVPQSLRDGSLALGATKAETIRQVVIPAALPGIFSAMLLGVSRAIGETMIVVMAAGQGANLTANPFEAVTTITVQIVMLITGDTDASTAAGPAFSLAFTLFCVTLVLNIVAMRVVRKYREAYD
ncbi:MAG: phosphate ABC transporter permease subunit PstC [Rhodobacteraceae bacterium]|nr:phosphate ABC transporter permease subunit PstC [Paracoccaceae bacterium]